MYNMAAQTQNFKVGDKVTYQDVDMEYYYRGYGLSYETKTAQVIEVCYKLSNGDCVPASKLSLVKTEVSNPEILLSKTQTPLSNGQ